MVRQILKTAACASSLDGEETYELVNSEICEAAIQRCDLSDFRSDGSLANIKNYTKCKEELSMKILKCDPDSYGFVNTTGRILKGNVSRSFFEKSDWEQGDLEMIACNFGIFDKSLNSRCVTCSERYQAVEVYGFSNDWLEYPIFKTIWSKALAVSSLISIIMILLFNQFSKATISALRWINKGRDI